MKQNFMSRYTIVLPSSNLSWPKGYVDGPITQRYRQHGSSLRGFDFEKFEAKSYLARLVPLQHWAMLPLFHVDYNIIISNQFVGFLYLIHALKAIKIWFGTTTECLKWSGSEKIRHHVDLCVNERPIFKNKSASYPWTNNGMA